jgi:hypothetical protein
MTISPNQKLKHQSFCMIALTQLGAIALCAMCILVNPSETKWVALALVGVLGIGAVVLALVLCPRSDKVLNALFRRGFPSADEGRHK